MDYKLGEAEEAIHEREVVKNIPPLYLLYSIILMYFGPTVLIVTMMMCRQGKYLHFTDEESESR